MHHKVIIVDRRIVVFGSYNFTGAASDSNDENVVIIHDADFASHFVTEFERLWVEDES
jgi:phosphatidylserine/phosphatidylglycerophosphate/cardiolipin synthase-like enzyme